MRKKRRKKDLREIFVHQITREQIKQFRCMSAMEKLQWLEDANKFVAKFLDISKRLRWDERLG